MMRYLFLLSTLLAFVVVAGQKQKVDLLVYNAKIYTVDKQFSIASGMVVQKGKIVATGDWKKLSAKYETAHKLNAEGKFIYPGFIDAHAHFWYYGLGLQDADLVGTKSWDEILQRLQDYVKRKNLLPGQSIIGRGWDQNDWAVKEFPTKEKLDLLFPDRPVILERVDGHAAIANQKALDLGGVKAGQKIDGGEIEVKNGQLTGILIDNAIGLAHAPNELTADKKKNALLEAQANCFAVGLTTVDDCGLAFTEVLFIDSLQKAGLLKMRIYAMLSDSKQNFDFATKHGKIKTPYLNVRSFKMYADGALGSRGAALLAPYNDRPDWRGFLLSSPQHFDSAAKILSKIDFQMNTHAIGDSGNRIILNVYGKYLKAKNDKRWRIEHAQVVNEKDFSLFGRYNIIPSVQPTHATSDMYWAGDRLGPARVKGAYAFQQLYKQNRWIPLGTDFPVEDISPFKTFYAAVFRQDAAAYPAGGYQMENALTRQQALRGMTIWAAKSNFEEKEKGSLEKGKFADFIMLDTDIMMAPATDVLKTTVLVTYINGEKVYEKK